MKTYHKLDKWNVCVDTIYSEMCACPRVTLQQLMAGSWSTFPMTISNRPGCGNKAHIVPVSIETTSPLSFYQFVSTIDACSYHICYNPRPLGTQRLNALEYIHQSFHLQLLQLRVDHHKHTTPTRTIPGQQKQQWYWICVSWKPKYEYNKSNI